MKAENRLSAPMVKFCIPKTCCGREIKIDQFTTEPKSVYGFEPGKLCGEHSGRYESIWENYFVNKLGLINVH